MKKITVIAIVLFGLSCSKSADDWGKLSPYIPENGVINGHVVDLVSIEELGEIGSRIYNAVRDGDKLRYTDPLEVIEHVPYDPKLGISREEYDIFVNSVVEQNNFQYRKVRPASLRFKVLWNGDIKIVCEDETSPIHNLKINRKENTAESIHGLMDKFKEIDFDNAVIGPQISIRWKRNTALWSHGTEDKGPTLLFAISRFKNKNVGSIFYSAIHLGEPVKNPFALSYTVHYPLQTKR
jgi:hypothetical protein